jgi:hypothetical protein
MFKDLTTAKSTEEFLYALTILVLVIVISSFILMFVWNRALVPHISTLKPMKTLFDALLMSIAISLIRGY